MVKLLSDLLATFFPSVSFDLGATFGVPEKEWWKITYYQKIKIDSNLYKNTSYLFTYSQQKMSIKKSRIKCKNET